MFGNEYPDGNVVIAFLLYLELVLLMEYLILHLWEEICKYSNTSFTLQGVSNTGCYIEKHVNSWAVEGCLSGCTVTGLIIKCNSTVNQHN